MDDRKVVSWRGVLCIYFLKNILLFCMSDFIGLLIGSGILVALAAFLLKKVFVLFKVFSSWGETSRSALAYSILPIFSLFVHPDGPSGSIPYFFMGIVLFLLDAYRVSKKSVVDNKGSQT